MAAKNVARRYARALMRLNGGDLKLARKRLESVLPVADLFSVEAIKKILCSPVVPVSLKTDVLNYAISKGAGDETLKNFVLSVLECGRIKNIPEIVECYHELMDEAEGVVKAEVLFPFEATEKEIKDLKTILEKNTKKKVDIIKKVDPSILGGFVIKIGNMIVDLSLKTKLEHLAETAAI